MRGAVGHGPSDGAVTAVAVVGATGAVGTDHAAPAARARVPGRRDRAVRLRALGRHASSPGDGTVQPLTDETIGGFDLALFSAGGATSREWAPRFVGGRRASSSTTPARGAMDPDVPLVVSEVNPEAIDDARKGIVANPNCTTMVAMLPAQGAARRASA